MRADIWLALFLFFLPGAAQRGVVSGVTTSRSTFTTDTVVTITVTGTNPCGAVDIEYGDGNRITHPLYQVPATIEYRYARPGTYRIRARGMGNCDGEAFASVRVLAPRNAQPLEPLNMRFREMDRDGDGVITRSEWRGNDRSFRVQDRNKDGVLSGEEVRAEGRRAHEWSNVDFASVDSNRNGVITPNEWRWASEDFEQQDVDRDGVLTRREFLAEAGGESGGQVVVPASVRWTDTGVSVRQGELVRVEATGTVQLSGDARDTADPSGARSGRRAPDAPLPALRAGGLIARIGDSAPIFVGTSPTFRAPASGQLYLGVNDDYLGDNRGEFRATVSVSRRNQ